jgi:ribonuclease T2
MQAHVIGTALRRLAAATVVGLTLAGLSAATSQAQRGPNTSGRMFDQDRSSQREHRAGEFDYYALVLSWSPTYCASSERSSPDPQCDRRDGRRFAFVLHGLWPQYERGFPDYCATRRKPFVPQSLIDNMLDIMPSPKLVIHEYRKHGTCSGLTPEGYYGLARRLFNQIQIPRAYTNPMENRMVAPADLVSDFLQANPKLKPEMLAISCGGTGNRLREIRVCFSKQGELRPCGRNENQRRLCSAGRMFVPPVRDASGRVPSRGDARPGNPLPGPRIVPNGGRSL